MPILKKEAVAAERPVIIVLYGTAGTGKTSLACTSENPLLIDTDRGFDRAASRVDTLVASSWADIDNEKDTIKGYKTIVVDTAKAMLDDYLSDFVVSQNYKLKTNGLKRFGEMADQFKMFVNFLRQNKSDIIFVCHDKETQEGDVIKHSPDCTGQSKDLLVRIADQVGYLTMVNNKRTIVFNPTDTTVGKNTANLEPITLPNCYDKAFGSAMADIIAKTKKAIVSKGEAQKAAQEALGSARERLASVESVDDANALIEVANSLAMPLQSPFKNEMIAVLKEKGIVFDVVTKHFVAK